RGSPRIPRFRRSGFHHRPDPSCHRRLGHALKGFIMGILTGYKVLDCSIAMAGPFAAQRLGDLGAGVIKSAPKRGERPPPAPAGGIKGNKINVSFLSLNRNKRSLAVDLKSEDGQTIIRQMASQADVFIQNYRPGVAQRLGVDYESLSALNPRLIYVSMSGFGE